jgi:hypothetical protein
MTAADAAKQYAKRRLNGWVIGLLFTPEVLIGVIVLAGILAVVSVVLPSGMLAGTTNAAGSVQPSAAASSIINNPKMLALYQSPLVHKECPGLSWTVVAALTHIESNDGQNLGPSSAGALGPSQFMPTTWDPQGRLVINFGQPYARDPDHQGYALDGGDNNGGPGDGIADIMNPYDSVPASARLLFANGGGNPATLPNALFAYNHATWYVNEVLDLASRLGSPGYGQTIAGGNAQQLAQSILNNSNISTQVLSTTSGQFVTYDLTQQASGGIPSNGVPLRADLLAVLNYIAQSFSFHISALESGGTGHSNSSAHYQGWAADIDIINGVPTTGRDAYARAVIQLILPVLPPGSGIGQQGCGPAVQFPADGHVSEFVDTCNHLHIQVP